MDIDIITKVKLSNGKVACTQDFAIASSKFKKAGLRDLIIFTGPIKGNPPASLEDVQLSSINIIKTIFSDDGSVIDRLKTLSEASSGQVVKFSRDETVLLFRIKHYPVGEGVDLRNRFLFDSIHAYRNDRFPFTVLEPVILPH